MILLELTVLKTGKIKNTFLLEGDTTFQVRIQKDSMQRKGKILALFRVDEEVYTVPDIEVGEVYDIPSECVGNDFSVSIVNDYPVGTSSTEFLFVRTISSSSTSGSSSYYTTQIKTASKIWNIQHNLNTAWWKLQINIIDNDGNVVYGDVDLSLTTNNLLVLNFEREVQGKIYIKK